MCIRDRTPPALEDCVRTSTVRDVDAFGNVSGARVETVNICVDFPIFIVETEDGEGTNDFTVFNERAREVAEILDRLNENCPVDVLDSNDVNVINRAIDSVIGSAVNLAASISFNVDNSIEHPSFNDGGLDTTDPTYHHYDVSTRLCSFIEIGCDVSLASSGQAIDNGTRRYTLPSFGLEATTPSINGDPETAFFPWNRAFSLEPSSVDYVSPIGLVTQQFLTSVDQIQSGTRYFGTVQNITDFRHAVFPGTITRTLEVRDDGLYGFTHGVGLNRAFCSSVLTDTFLADIPNQRVIGARTAAKFLQVIAAVSNDIFGQVAFERLDINMRREFRQQFGFSAIDPPISREEIEQLEEARRMIEMLPFDLP